MENHCQICEREIKAKTGVIAHHGYTRPDRGSGWQTASCWGARHLPYEKSCDQIQPCIDHINQYIANQKEMLKELRENPPAKIGESYISMMRERKYYDRPEGFDAKANEKDTEQRYQSYEYEHKSLIKGHQYQIKTSQKDVERLTKRLADWKLV